MRFIAHRRNTAAELAATPTGYGVEIDLRGAGDGRIVLHHDPFRSGEDFADWLRSFRHRTLILNVKEDGLETRAAALARARGIEDYFFLDQPVPSLLRCAARGERRCAVRVSEFEPVEMALRFAGRVDWVWVDCFTRLALTRSEAERLRSAGFKLCIVSPELQGRAAAHEIPGMARLVAERGIAPDAVCTKTPERWLEAGVGR